MKGLRVKKLFTALLLIFGVTVGVSACASAEPVGLSEGTIIIDVRTPAEFATGHLEGALNIDVQSPDFQAKISQLDPTKDYFVYCRSGNRSGQAMSQMSQMGFTSMLNGGSVDEANRRSGVPVVTN
jgi:rhodanese-related sulfurtransferase